MEGVGEVGAWRQRVGRWEGRGWRCDHDHDKLGCGCGNGPFIFPLLHHHHRFVSFTFTIITIMSCFSLSVPTQPTDPPVTTSLTRVAKYWVSLEDQEARPSYTPLRKERGSDLDFKIAQ